MLSNTSKGICTPKAANVSCHERRAVVSESQSTPSKSNRRASTVTLGAYPA